MENRTSNNKGESGFDPVLEASLNILRNQKIQNTGPRIKEYYNTPRAIGLIFIFLIILVLTSILLDSLIKPDLTESEALKGVSGVLMAVPVIAWIGIYLTSGNKGNQQPQTHYQMAHSWIWYFIVYIMFSLSVVCGITSILLLSDTSNPEVKAASLATDSILLAMSVIFFVYYLVRLYYKHGTEV